jgi:pimeloyl-ACP methyl ester carboxylesterase
MPPIIEYLKKTWHGLCLSLVVCGLVATPLGAEPLKAKPWKPPVPPQARFAPDFEQDPTAWIQHLIQSDFYYPLQTACKPFYLPPQGPRKGTVLLFHGYSACPQQFWELAPHLAARGFAVYVPVLPGHGRRSRQEAEKWLDEPSDLPTETSWRRYEEYAAQIAQIMPKEGIRAVMGLSLGGAVAASALIQAPKQFDRGILGAPLLDINPPSNYFLPPLSALAPEYPAKWDDSCEVERAGGRGGYCQFRLRALRGMQRLGQETLLRLNEIKIPIQIVGVEKDGTASNSAQKEASEHLPQNQICLFEKGANHSLLSRFDSPFEDKFWIAPLNAMSLSFIEKGSYFETAGPAAELGLMRCKAR